MTQIKRLLLYFALPILISQESDRAFSQAFELTPEERAQLNALPPSLRVQAMERLNQLESNRRLASVRPETPEVVIPSQRVLEEDVQQSNLSAFEESETEVSPVERKTDTNDLSPFGYDLFSGTPTTFAPVTEIPVPVDYIIGPGDQVRVQYFGKVTSSYDLYVGRDGLLQIPELGPIAAAGQRFSELKQDIGQRVSEQMIGVQSFVTLGELRSIRVFMLGDVNRPGSYTVSSLSTMTNALFVSGGIQSVGTLRNIQLKRQGETITTLDLYDLLLDGDTSNDARLQPGDVIFVPPIGRQVGVSGEVKRPAIYELGEEDTSIESVIDLAGGFLPTAYKPLSQLERISANGLKEIKDVDLSQQAPMQNLVRDGDLLRIFSNLNRADNIVQLEGLAERPGNYEWSEGMRVRNLIRGYDDVLPEADLQYALVVSRNLSNGRISVRSFSLEQAFANLSSRHNLELRKRDRLLIFDDSGESDADEISQRRELLDPVIETLQRQATSDNPQKVVAIEGYVRYPGAYPLEEQMTLNDLVRAAGGFSQDAFTLNAELIRFEDNQKRQRETVLLPVQLDGKGRGLDLPLRSFDQLLIKRIPDWAEEETVELAGEVRFPGTYRIERGETLLNILNRAGGLTDLAYPDAALFLRESLRQLERTQIERLRERIREDINASNLQDDVSAAESIETATELVEQLDSAEAVGRLVINLPAILEEDNPSIDVVLKGGDQLIVPQRPQSVTIIGSVNYPTSHFYDPELDRDEYISLSGGLLKRADKNGIYIVRANGRVENLERSRFFPKNSQPIYAGDTIVVPIDVDRMKPLRYWGEVSQIIYQLALGAAAVNSF